MKINKIHIGYGLYGFSQLINLGVPLIIASYIINKCGMENWGRIATYISIFLIINIFTDYGNLINGVKTISVNKNNFTIQKEYLIKTYNLKFIVLFFIFICFSVSTIFFFNQRFFIIFGFVYVLSLTLSPIWYFQAIENYFIVNKIIFFSKTLQLILLFIFVDNISDYIYYFLVLGISNILVFSFYLNKIRKKHAIVLNDIIIFKKNNIFITELPIVLSNLSITLYTQLPILIINYFLGNIETGIFKIIEMTLNIFRSYLSVFFSLTYPRFCVIFSESKLLGVQFLKKVNGLNFLFLFLVSCFLLLFIYYTPINFSSYHIDTKYLFYIIFIPFIILINIPFYQMLLYHNKHKILSLFTIINVILMLIFGTILTLYFNLIGIITSVYITETFITAAIIIYFYNIKNKLNE